MFQRGLRRVIPELFNVPQRLGHRFEWRSAVVDAKGHGSVFMAHHSLKQQILNPCIP